MRPKEYEEITEALVGRSIVKTIVKTDPHPWNDDEMVTSISYILDDGRVLQARSIVGMCSCGNGDWTVSAPQIAGTAVITRVEAVEDLVDDSGDYDPDAEVGKATLRLFIYQDTIKTEILQSEGKDNGYYGWGYELDVVA